MKTIKNNEEKLFEKIINDQVVRQHLAKQSLEHFLPIYFHQYMEYQSAPFHKEMFDILEDDAIKLAVFCAFRGSAKSTIITTAYVLWAILGIQQKKFIVICGQTDAKARQYLMNIKNQLLNNALLRMDLGPFEEERNSIGNATALIIKRLGVKIMITSVEQSIRGMRHNEHRPDLIIVDDIEDINSVKTREGRDKAFNWLTGELIPAGNTKTRIIAVGNLLHEDSVLKRLQEKIDNHEMRHMRGLYREYPIVDRNGNPLWPGKYPTQESIDAEREKTMNEIAWYREYLLEIISSEEQVVHPDWIQQYIYLPKRELSQIAIGVDLAISTKASADCTAVLTAYVYGHGKNMEIYIQPNPTNSRMPFPEQVETIISTMSVAKLTHQRVKAYVENVGYQDAMVQMLQSRSQDVIGVTPTTDKRARLSLTTSLLRAGKILFPETGCEELIEQLLGFGKEKHDDLVDAFSIVVLQLIGQRPQGSFGLTGGHKLGSGKPVPYKPWWA
jgi:predicted phage terminase large subunit-like protein